MRQFVLAFAVMSAAVPLRAQTQDSVRSVERTPNSRQDFQGIWTNETLTPLERPKKFEDKAFYTEAEREAFQGAVRDYNQALQGEENLKTSGDVGFEAAERGPLWGNRRTALIVDPPNGMLPPRLPEAQRRLEALKDRRIQHLGDGPEEFSDRERCRTWNSPPMLAPPSNTQIQIVQTPGYVLLSLEMFGEVRIIPLDGRPHLAPGIRQLKGDSRGRWEGDSLVVETTNFVRKGAYSVTDPLNGLDESLRVIEQFTLVDPDTMLYRFTVDDATVYGRSWTAELPLTRATKPMFEYACHEGNYSLGNSLTGARAEQSREAAVPR
jgi:hypothetical protein